LHFDEVKSLLFANFVLLICCGCGWGTECVVSDEYSTRLRN